MSDRNPERADPRPGQATAEESRLATNSALLTVAAGAVAVVSYICGLLMAHLLDVSDYSTYAAAQQILGVVGIVSLALIPLPLADGIRATAAGSEERRRSVTFAVFAAATLGLAAAIVSGGVTLLFARVGVAVVVAISALMLFGIAPVWGWLQGELRFGGYAVSSLVEVTVRLVFSVAAGLLGWGVEGALAGFAIGAGSLFATRWRALRPDLAWYPAVLRESARWTVTGDVAGTQLVVSALVVLDVVLVARWGHGSAEGAGYAALATLTKGPIYVAVGTVLVAFPLLRSAGIRTAYVLRETLRSFTALALLAAVVLGTVPVDLLGLVLPAQYVAVAVLLPWMALSGLGYACVAMLSTVLLALRAYRRTKIGLLQATVAIPLSLVLGWGVGGLHGLAIAAAVASMLATAVLGLIAWPLLPSGTALLVVGGFAAAATAAVTLEWLRAFPVLWSVVAALLSAVVFAGMRSSGRDRRARDDRGHRAMAKGST